MKFIINMIDLILLNVLKLTRLLYEYIKMKFSIPYSIVFNRDYLFINLF